MHPTPMNTNDKPQSENVYPVQSFLEVERLLRKLNLTPADGLQLLAEVLGDLDRQIEEHEDAQDADVPYRIFESTGRTGRPLW